MNIATLTNIKRRGCNHFEATCVRGVEVWAGMWVAAGKAERGQILSKDNG